MARARIRWNRRAFAEIRTLPAVQSEVNSLAAGIAERAGDGYEARPATITGGRVRTRAAVVTATAEAVRDQAINHTLERAL